MENASVAFLDAVRKSMRLIRSALGAAFIDPRCSPLQSVFNTRGYLRREEVTAGILARAEGGATIKQIVRETGQSRGLVRKILRGQHSDVFRTRQSSLEPHLPWLDAQWAAASRNGAELWRRLRASGFRGSLRVFPNGRAGGGVQKKWTRQLSATFSLAKRSPRATSSSSHRRTLCRML
jgi:hypothetical protein